MPNQNGLAQVPVVRLMKISGRSARNSSMREMAASKSEPNREPGAGSAMPEQPSSLKWFTPFSRIMCRHISRKSS